MKLCEFGHIDIFIDTYEIPSTNLTLPLLKKNYLKYCDIFVRYVYATCHISVFMTLKEFFSSFAWNTLLRYGINISKTWKDKCGFLNSLHFSRGFVKTCVQNNLSTNNKLLVKNAFDNKKKNVKFKRYISSIV